MLRAYEEICPGMAKQLLEDTRAVSQHKMGIETKMADGQLLNMNRDYDEGRRGQFCAVAVVAMAIGGSVILGLHHAEVASTFLGVTGLGTLVAHFIYGRKYGRRPGQSSEQAEQGADLPSSGRPLSPHQ